MGEHKVLYGDSSLGPARAVIVYHHVLLEISTVDHLTQQPTWIRLNFAYQPGTHLATVIQASFFRLGCVLVCFGMAVLITLVTVEVVSLSIGAGVFAAWAAFLKDEMALEPGLWSIRVSGFKFRCGIFLVHIPQWFHDFYGLYPLLV